MEPLIRIALAFLNNHRSGGNLGERITTGALLSTIAGLAMIAGLGCGAAALWLYLAPQIGSAGAAMSVAAVLLVSAGILLLVARSQFHGEQTESDLPPLGEELFEDLREGFEKNKMLALMAAVVAGLLVGNGRKRD